MQVSFLLLIWRPNDVVLWFSLFSLRFTIPFVCVPFEKWMNM